MSKEIEEQEKKLDIENDSTKDSFFKRLNKEKLIFTSPLILASVLYLVLTFVPLISIRGYFTEYETKYYSLFSFFQVIPIVLIFVGLIFSFFTLYNALNSKKINYLTIIASGVLILPFLSILFALKETSKLTNLWYWTIFEINVMNGWHSIYHTYYEAKLFGGIIFIIIPILYLTGNITYGHYLNKKNSIDVTGKRLDGYAIKFVLGTLIAFLCSIGLTYGIRMLVTLFLLGFTHT